MEETGPLIETQMKTLREKLFERASQEASHLSSEALENFDEGILLEA